MKVKCSFQLMMVKMKEQKNLTILVIILNNSNDDSSKL